MFEDYSDDEIVTLSMENLKNLPRISESMTSGMLIDANNHVFVSLSFLVGAYALELTAALAAPGREELSQMDLAYYQGMRDVLVDMHSLHQMVQDINTNIDDVIDQLLD